MASDTLKDKFQKMYDELDIAIMVVDSITGEMLFANQRVSADIKKNMEEIIGNSYQKIFLQDFAEQFDELAAKCRDGLVHQCVYYWTDRNIWEQISCQRIEWPGKRVALLLSITNITEVSRLEYKYRRMAFYDSLLELPNGSKLVKDISEISNLEHTALIHFDIDRLVNINEMYGWEIGDSLLQKISEWIRQTLNSHGMLYRTGDDEFCLLIYNSTFENAKKLTEAILARFNEPWNVGRTPVYCTIMIGLVYGKNIKGDLRNLLYRTLNSPEYEGKGYVVYDENLDSQVQKRLRFRQNLTDCIQDNMKGFSVQYQPIVNAATGRWIGAEALCRWMAPDGAMVSPLAFITEAEKLNLIGKVDDWTHKTALKQCKQWGVDSKLFVLDLNLSPIHAINEDFTSNFLSWLEQINYPKDKVNLEITESSKINFSNINVKSLQSLREEGVSLSLDDFGTGYSSFDTLIKMPVENLKTEKSFVSNLEHDQYLQYLFQIMVDIARKVGMRLIAEGVERETQRNILREIGVEVMQGYLFSKPLTKEEFGAQLQMIQVN